MSDKKIKINVPPERVEAKYSDFAIISKNALGFNLDFAQKMPGGRQVNVVSRVALSPQHAKLLSNLLAFHVKKYEEEFGEIKVPKKTRGSRQDNKMIHFVK